jgi:arylsulfatase A-like enzyme
LTRRQFPASAGAPKHRFIPMDDQRWDELGCAGHPFVKTPNLDPIAREGAIFRNAFVTTPLCRRAAPLSSQANTRTRTESPTPAAIRL